MYACMYVFRVILQLQISSTMSMSRKKRTTITKEIYSLIINMSSSAQKNTTEIALALGLSITAVRNVLSQSQDGVDFKASTIKRKETWNAKSEVFGEADSILFNTVSCNNALVQSEMSAKVNEITGVKFSQSTISRKLKKMKMTRKRLTLVPEERNSVANIDKRALFASKITRLPVENLVFLDESGFNKHLRRRYGYSYVNEKAYINVPGNRNINRSLLCAINMQGIVAFEYRTGAFNGELLVNFLETKLAPYFASNRDHVLIMDNVPFHRSKNVTTALSRLKINKEYLPPWSPQLNPIEEFFSMVKAKYRSIKTLNRTISIEDALQDILSCNDYSEQCSGFWRSMRGWLDKALQKKSFI